MTVSQIIAICVFVIVLAFVVTEKLHRAVAAMAGAVVLLLAGVITFDQGIESIDFNTIGVLVGMMLYVAVVKTCGLFEFIAIKSAKIARGNPWRIMVYFTIITAVLSALLDNVTTVLLMGPMTVMVRKAVTRTVVSGTTKRSKVSGTCLCSHFSICDMIQTAMMTGMTWP